MTEWEVTFLQDGPGDNKGELLQRLHVLVAGAEDADLRQAHHQRSGHGGLVVVPAANGARYVAADDGAGRREAVVGKEHAARLKLQLVRDKHTTQFDQCRVLFLEVTVALRQNQCLAAKVKTSQKAKNLAMHFSKKKSWKRHI